MDNKRSRSWCFTLNNYTPEEFTVLEQVDCTYIVMGRETGESGTPHLQGWVYMPSVKSLKQMRAIISERAHLEVAKGNAEQNMAYCKKEGLWVERGVPPASQGAKGDKEKERWAVALKQAKETGEVEDPQIAFVHCRTIEYLRHSEQLKTVLTDTDVVHEWYYGKTGTGKSRKAREENPNAYLKMCNKWWNGYDGQEVVLLEDFDQSHKVLNHHMKIWADRYPFLAESKGSASKIRPRKIIVTSNYHPNQIWDTEEELGPILRRFAVTCFAKMEEVDNH